MMGITYRVASHSGIRRMCVLPLAMLMLLPLPAMSAEARPPLITEEFFSASQTPYGRSWYTQEERNEAEVWHKALLGMGIKSPAPPERYWSGNGDCKYQNSLNTLEEIRAATGADSAYQRIWAENQNRVFSACDGRDATATPPMQPQGSDLPPRAGSDYLYQLASWHFYKEEYEEALKLYQQVETMRQAPLRPQAAYMTIRSLAYLNRDEEAYAKIASILADASLRPVHNIAGNYRFVLMYYPDKDKDALAEEHLRWLVQMMKVTPEKAVNAKQAIADHSDALQQLNMYFPHYENKGRDKEPVLDWWLQDGTPDSARMQAVKTLAPQEELVDWLQAKWALNIFDQEWLLALHQPENTYWQQNHHIVEHAWQRWQHGDGLEWLQAAIQRVHPKDELAPQIIAAATPYMTRDYSQETNEYREWLRVVWTNLLRVHLGRGEEQEAVALVEAHPDFSKLSPNRYLDSTTAEYRETIERVLRWLVYVGKADEARQVLNVAAKLDSQHFTDWRILLAQDWNQVLDAIRNDRYGNVSNGSELWQTLVNRLSAEHLFELASNDTLNANQRPLMARAALTRAVLLDMDNETIDRYAALAAKLTPSLREAILAGMERHDESDYVDFLLRHPRFRPVANLSMAPSQQGQGIEVDAIDVYNHNDNNWWCRVNDAGLTDDILTTTLVFPMNAHTYYWHGSKINNFFTWPDRQQPEYQPYIENQKALLARHPYHALVDEKELAALARIPSGPQYLTEAMVSREWWNRLKFWRDKDASAANLHRAIRTTRYGCQRDGSHAAYSHAAFKILHDRYPHSVWAKATPYWFGCKHFRDGCQTTEEKEN